MPGLFPSLGSISRQHHGIPVQAVQVFSEINPWLRLGFGEPQSHAKLRDGRLDEVDVSVAVG